MKQDPRTIWMSASNMKFTFLLVYPDTEGVERVVRSLVPGRNPYENPRKSSS